MTTDVVTVTQRDTVTVVNDVIQVVTVTNPLEIVTVGIQGPAGISAADVQFIAGETLGGHRALRIYQHRAYYASADNDDHAPQVIGISVNASNTGDLVTVLPIGEITDSSFNWFINQPIYVGLNGILTQTLPVTAKFIQVIGYPTAVNSMYVKINDAIMLE